MLTIEERHQDGQVLAHVAGRPVEGLTEHVLDHDLMGEADPEREPTTGPGLDGERLSGQHHGVPWVGRDHGGPEPDAIHLTADHAEGGQSVVAEDL